MKLTDAPKPLQIEELAVIYSDESKSSQSGIIPVERLVSGGLSKSTLNRIDGKPHDIVKNKPCSGYEIVSYNVGGKSSYESVKVKHPDGFVFTVFAVNLLSAMIHSKITINNGKIEGDYVIAKCASNLTIMNAEDVGESSNDLSFVEARPKDLTIGTEVQIRSSTGVYWFAGIVYGDLTSHELTDVEIEDIGTSGMYGGYSNRYRSKKITPNFDKYSEEVLLKKTLKYAVYMSDNGKFTHMSLSTPVIASTSSELKQINRADVLKYAEKIFECNQIKDRFVDDGVMYRDITHKKGYQKHEFVEHIHMNDSDKYMVSIVNSVGVL